MKLSDAIKHLAVGAVDAGAPVELIPAEVTAVSPLELKLKDHDKLIIPADAVIVPKRMRAGEDDQLQAGEGNDRGFNRRAIVFYTGQNLTAHSCIIGKKGDAHANGETGSFGAHCRQYRADGAILQPGARHESCYLRGRENRAFVR